MPSFLHWAENMLGLEVNKYDNVHFVSFQNMTFAIKKVTITWIRRLIPMICRTLSPTIGVPTAVDCRNSAVPAKVSGNRNGCWALILTTRAQTEIVVGKVTLADQARVLRDDLKSGEINEQHFPRLNWRSWNKHLQDGHIWIQRMKMILSWNSDLHEETWG